MTRPAVSAAAGSLCLVPFIVINAVVGNRIEPLFSLIRPGSHTSAREYVLLVLLLVLLPVGAAVAAQPMLRRGNDGRRRLYPVNAAVATLLCLAFIVLSVGFGSDVYRCDVLGIPNCD